MTLSPKELGYHFPAEWEKHAATWLSWPHKEASWPGRLNHIFPTYSQFIKIIAAGERVCINVNDQTMQEIAIEHLKKAQVDLNQVSFFIHPTNDAWCRDHGPAFLVNNASVNRKVIIDWNYNAWGEKYPPYDLDDQIPKKISQACRIPCFHPNIVMEGGSVEFNGKGTLLTTRSCLLNPNRNPHLNQAQVENYLKSFYGVDHILWLDKGIVGDDTDGHIDDITRFVNQDTVVTILPNYTTHPDFEVLNTNCQALKKMKLESGKPLNVITLPTPSIYEEDGQILPCSYANFYICNAAVIVPTFEDPSDDSALAILSSCFKDRPVIGLNSKDVIWGLGSFHCLSQQEPV